MNLTQNLINDYSTYIYNNDFGALEKKILNKSYKCKYEKKKNLGIHENILKYKISKNNFINNCISSKFLKKINSGLYKNFKYKIINKQIDEISKKNKSYEKGNKKLYKTKILNKYLNKKFFFKNILSSIRNFSKNKKEKLKEYNSKNNNNRNSIRPNYNNCITSFNKSLFEENYNALENQSLQISKNIKKIQNLNVFESSTFEKKIIIIII